ncbi:MAG: hypothetical protein IJR53_03585 [Bacteroidales bacterium]|nr:hypothetical protein [Bacteroidales bacterium]
MSESRGKACFGYAERRGEGGVASNRVPEGRGSDSEFKTQNSKFKIYNY